MQVYADNAATTKMSRRAIETMNLYMEEHYGNPSSLHSLGQKAAEALQEARELMASHLGCDARELYFTAGGSEADNQALLSAAKLGAKKNKRHIISTAFEHHAILHTLKKLEADGFRVTLLPVHSDGLVRCEELAAALSDDTCLVSIMYANNEIGTIQPIAALGAICRTAGVLFHTDAVQAAGHLHIDVRAQNIDMLSLSAHKFGGPRGAGVLFARRGLVLSSLIEGGAQERGKRAGTENTPAIMAMAAAFDEACQSIESYQSKVTLLRDKLIAGLAQIPHAALNGDATARLPGNANFCFEGIEGESLLLLLDAKGVCASTGSACASGSLDPSHVLLAIGRVHEVAHGSLRLSLSAESSEADVDYLLTVIPEVVSYLRGISPAWRDLCEGKAPFILK